MMLRREAESGGHAAGNWSVGRSASRLRVMNQGPPVGVVPKLQCFAREREHHLAPLSLDSGVGRAGWPHSR